MLYKCGIVLLLGPSVVAVIVFEIALNATAIFSHANMKLPVTFIWNLIFPFKQS